MTVLGRLAAPEQRTVAHDALGALPPAPSRTDAHGCCVATCIIFLARRALFFLRPSFRAVARGVRLGREHFSLSDHN